jgi:hypothetical protein
MKQIGNSNEDMLALLEAVVGIKNELPSTPKRGNLPFR